MGREGWEEKKGRRIEGREGGRELKEVQMEGKKGRKKLVDGRQEGFGSPTNSDVAPPMLYSTDVAATPHGS